MRLTRLVAILLVISGAEATALRGVSPGAACRSFPDTEAALGSQLRGSLPKESDGDFSLLFDGRSAGREATIWYTCESGGTRSQLVRVEVESESEGHLVFSELRRDLAAEFGPAHKDADEPTVAWLDQSVYRFTVWMVDGWLVAVSLFGHDNGEWEVWAGFVPHTTAPVATEPQDLTSETDDAWEVLAGFHAPTTAWVPWEPRDPSAVEAMERALESYGLKDEVEEEIEFDPLSVVPDERFLAAFPQLGRTDTRIQHCQLGSPGSDIATVEFTPHPISDTTVRRMVFRCRHDSSRRASSCNFAPDVAYDLGDPEQAFRLSEEIDPANGIALMRLLAKGAYRSEMPDFPPIDWPQGWWSQHGGRYLGLAEVKSSPRRFELSLAGCACRQQLVLGYGSPRANSEVLIVGQFRRCI